MTKPTFSHWVKKLFDENGTLTLKDLYSSISQNEDVDISEDTLNHRIRSAIYSMKKSGQIKRIADATYKKVK